MDPGQRLVPAGTRYELVRQIALGGMAEVYLARAIAPSGLETLVALKRIRPDLPEKDYLTMWRDEVRLVERLRHPNLLYVLDTSAAMEHGYYVMEYLHGCDVRQLVLTAAERKRRLDLELVLPIIIGASAGLHHAHDVTDDNGNPLNLVHRDISPANLFVTHDGRVKAIDFGIASYDNRSSQTRVGIVKGKLRYIAPEQFQSKPIDRRSDVFALAIVLWELTVGKRPYDAENDYEVMRLICDVDAPKPSLHIPDYPPELEEIVLKGLKRDRAERFQSAEELHRALTAFADNRGISYSTGEVATRMKLWMRGETPIATARYRFDPNCVDNVSVTGVTSLRERATRSTPEGFAAPADDRTIIDPVMPTAA
jgi:serine/threonine-protein kinase